MFSLAHVAGPTSPWQDKQITTLRDRSAPVFGDPDGTRALLTWEDNSVRLLDLGDTAGAGASEAGAGTVSENGWFR